MSAGTLFYTVYLGGDSHPLSAFLSFLEAYQRTPGRFLLLFITLWNKVGACATAGFFSVGTINSLQYVWVGRLEVKGLELNCRTRQGLA